MNKTAIKKEVAPGGRDRKLLKDQTGTHTSSMSSQKDFNIEDAKGQGISGFLFQGRDHATSSKALILLLGLSSQRELCSIIAKARENGEIILSNSNGYFLPSDGEDGLNEIRDCISTLRAKGISTLRTASALNRPLRDLYGQEFICDLQIEEV